MGAAEAYTDLEKQGGSGATEVDKDGKTAIDKEREGHAHQVKTLRQAFVAACCLAGFLAMALLASTRGPSPQPPPPAGGPSP
eukprot:CAMPEP_0173393748 /NCGR_PEP_ID=MMETSP1356-20130122/22289_1 /TAXON_ID=77927 ORGANISM="Hemiselmis virescens, Strain PCC157" /NCGR_SAMPLE_ID=MMETSP1356 /ASSEMBLY_ACC=CAM_ASM_000847 /LENGTH=81 /DNA_ID=CAMNT_0014351813 /DNA_START=55 /DNA_END=297 /DNA_ORIENTATION=+